MDFAKFVEWAFLAIIGGSIAWCASFLSKISQSIIDLNTKIVIVLERLAYQEKEIDNHNGRISKLETKRGKQ